MRYVKLMTVAVLGMASLTSLAHAQGYVTDGLGTGRDPLSTRASNIGPQDTRSGVAPALPIPSSVGPDSSPVAYLHAARNALAAGHTGEAQQSLEMAETRQLARVVPPDAANTPDGDPVVSQIDSALRALGHGDRAQALQIVDQMIG
jgi:hypothetical protein